MEKIEKSKDLGLVVLFVVAFELAKFEGLVLLHHFVGTLIIHVS